MDYEKIELIENKTSLNDITFYLLKGSEKINLCLRGQPTEGDGKERSMQRAILKNGDWDVRNDYTYGDIIKFGSTYDVSIEGNTTAKALHMHSISKGWICVEIDKNEFVKSEFTKMENDGRYYKHRDDSVCLKVPRDIDKVFAE